MVNKDFHKARNPKVIWEAAASPMRYITLRPPPPQKITHFGEGGMDPHLIHCSIVHRPTNPKRHVDRLCRLPKYTVISNGQTDGQTDSTNMHQQAAYTL